SASGPSRQLHSYPTRRASVLRGQRSPRQDGRAPRGGSDRGCPRPPRRPPSHPRESRVIPEGETVVAVVAAGNRDPNRFEAPDRLDRKSTRLNSSHVKI